MAKPALGKGLGALITAQAAGSGAPRPPALAQPAPGDVVNHVSLDQVVPSPLQPRKEFIQEQLAELMESIREHGIIQPLIVRRVNGKLELIAGERRFRASRELGLKEVPVIVREASDKDVLEMALIENLQREDLNPIEEGRAYARLAKDFDMRQEDIAQRVGKNRATVANTMRLLDLATPVQTLLSSGKLSTGHAKVLLTLKDPEQQEKAAEEIVKKGLTVRAAEKLAGSILNPPPPKPVLADNEVSHAIQSVEQRLMHHLTTNISVKHSEKKGQIEIDYYGVEDLNRLLALMGVPEEQAEA
ncbi:chromosome partitioning protein, ParB family [Prosthecobacter debontii]|uniref:Chromosome partitioning protein, ParB family n=1 Tax=Prosthecobacter debontii TaxID=48467 RepID=A0A1T4Z4W0_9BACT|nr:ParB/RepB/Spo0J family partition protein [Prosthecobacter debontii]SKB08601.1 chromosome partitioning protein, ParB family [Prosthecobacter debontii]